MEEAIRRKLLADGDGTGDDKRIVTLFKTFLKWEKEKALAAQNGETSKMDDQATLRKLNMALEQCACAYKKSHLVYKVNREEIEYYKEKQKKIEERILEASQRIAECKQELQEAKQIRKHRQEYDALAGLIEQYPEREQTEDEVEKTSKEVAELKTKGEKLQEKLELRKKQFHVLLLSLQELQGILESDEKEENGSEDTVESQEAKTSTETMDTT